MLCGSPLVRAAAVALCTPAAHGAAHEQLYKGGVPETSGEERARLVAYVVLVAPAAEAEAELRAVRNHTPPSPTSPPPVQIGRASLRPRYKSDAHLSPALGN